VEAEHHRVCDDDYHDEAIEPDPLSEPHHRLPYFETSVKYVHTARIPPHLLIILNRKVMSPGSKPAFRLIKLLFRRDFCRSLVP
jgi:hypothetical protein